ncbi:MAG: transcriptional regulator NrdR [Patescibacteria group bacterium]
MRCPACNHADTKVNDSRLLEQDNTVRRRRICEKCGFRFSTLEEMEILDLSVIKRDGRHEAYSRDKVASGVYRALEKRPISKQELHSLLAAIERDIYVLNRAEIKTSQIGEIIMRHLQKLDKVAYIRFASVYRAFTDVAHFRDEISKLSKKPVKKKYKTKKNERTR